MTSSRKPITSRPWLASSAIAVTAFLVLYLTSGFVGLSDDESYYWVLAQKPALGYAYHPPMVAWMIFVAQKLLGWISGPSSAWVVRFFSSACMGVLVKLALDWIEEVSPKSRRPVLSMLTLISFAGLFGLGWMMVPDVPLFLGWALAFFSTWKIANRPKVSNAQYGVLVLGVAMATLGKYSGVLIPLSVLTAVYLSERRRMLKTFSACVLGTIIALIPIVIWNSQHEWQSVLYQIQERHQDAEISWKRYLRFWLIEWIAAGPLLVFYTLNLMKRAFAPEKNRVIRFVACWIAPPALIYCLQPLWSDFKPHWAFIVWLPGALALAWEVGHRKFRLLPVQIGMGLLLITAVLVSLHVPVMGMAISHFTKNFDPKLDVTNDLYGWNRFAEFVKARPGEKVYVTASRYQTASQAAAALGSLDQVSLLPRDLKARDEWPTLPVSNGTGPDWPELTLPVLYVGDIRYDAPPAYKSSRCIQLPNLEARRWGLLAKQILLWECKPINWPE